MWIKVEEKSLNELLLLMNEYKNSVKTSRQELTLYRESVKERIVKIIEKDIDTSTNSQRLQNYLEQTKISDLDFLYRSLNHMRSNNEKGSLSTEKLILLLKVMVSLLSINYLI